VRLSGYHRTRSRCDPGTAEFSRTPALLVVLGEQFFCSGLVALSEVEQSLRNLLIRYEGRDASVVLRLIELGAPSSRCALDPLTGSESFGFLPHGSDQTRRTRLRRAAQGEASAARQPRLPRRYPALSCGTLLRGAGSTLAMG